MCNKVINSENEWHAGVDRRGFGTKQDFIPLFFFMYVQILSQGQKAVVAMVEYEFFDIFYSKFQLVSTFSICSKFRVENWLLCCDLICKWVTCRSGCKRFGNQLFICYTNSRTFFCLHLETVLYLWSRTARQFVKHANRRFIQSSSLIDWKRRFDSPELTVS